MRKQDLIALLNDLPDDAEIRIDQPTHDHWRRHIAADIIMIDEVQVAPSAYHNDNDVIQDGDEWEDDMKAVYLLR